MVTSWVSGKTVPVVGPEVKFGVAPVAVTIATPGGGLAEPSLPEELLAVLLLEEGPPEDVLPVALLEEEPAGLLALSDAPEDELVEELLPVALLTGALEAIAGEPPPLEQPDNISAPANAASPIIPLRIIPITLPHAGIDNPLAATHQQHDR